MSAALEEEAARWLAEKSADATRCPILLAVEVLSVVVACPDIRIPGVEARVVGRRAPETIVRAVEAARAARPRPVAPAAAALLAEHQHLLGHFGGLAGEVDVAEASAVLTWALKSIAALLTIASAGGAR